jgi:two-component system, NarL family, response regulator
MIREDTPPWMITSTEVRTMNDFSSAPRPSFRVLLVDDHAIVREGLAAVLAADGIDVVGQAGDGDTALDLLEQLQPDVCMVDMRMSPMDGCELTREIRQRCPSCKVVVLTTYDTDEEVYRALEAGAASYLLKDVDASSLVRTIRDVHAGRRVISPEIATRLADMVSGERLTPRQHEVLACLALGQSNLEIASTLYISEGTVKAHVKAILAKLDARDRTQALITAMRRGLLRPSTSGEVVAGNAPLG